MTITFVGSATFSLDEVEGIHNLVTMVMLGSHQMNLDYMYNNRLGSIYHLRVPL